LDHLQKLINDHLKQLFTDRKPSTLYEPIHYVLSGGGKRIRPVLVILACQAVGGTSAAALDAAIAVELLHNFTLVHDDIMDNDDTRRGRPTVHKKWDVDVALLAGDGLLALAYQSLLRTPSPRISEVATIFTDGIIEICEGQALDREFESRRDVTIDEYLCMIRKKTACLLNLSARTGGIIGDGEPDQVKSLGDFASNLGLAFQIQDDLLDITSEQEVIGKANGSDVMRKKQTYLSIHALTHGDAKSVSRLKDIFAKPFIERSDVSLVKEIFQRSDSIKATQECIQQYLQGALENLERLPESEAKSDLRNFLNFISHRKS
jgi:geranylgeranyl diphosphate synthase type II